jgi:hypothetical protein
LGDGDERGKGAAMVPRDASKPNRLAHESSRTAAVFLRLFLLR